MAVRAHGGAPFLDRTALALRALDDGRDSRRQVMAGPAPARARLVAAVPGGVRPLACAVVSLVAGALYSTGRLKARPLVGTALNHLPPAHAAHGPRWEGRAPATGEQPKTACHPLSERPPQALNRPRKRPRTI
jgi:hypothetical protein